VLPGLTDLKAIKEIPVRIVPFQDLKAIKAIREIQALLVLKAIKVLLGLKDLKAIKVLPGLTDLKVIKAQKDPKEIVG
jgi:hypothetical protein